MVPGRSGTLSRRSRALVGACLALGAVAAAGAPPAGAAAPCEPVRGVQSDRTARADHGHSSEVTEYYEQGAYKVTKCDARGRQVSTQTVAPVTEPGGRRSMVPIAHGTGNSETHLLHGDPSDPVWARDFAAERDKLVASVVPPTASAPKASAAAGKAPATRGRAVARASADDSCTNGEWYRTGPAWAYSGYHFRINEADFGRNDVTIKGLIYGHWDWDTTYTNCNFADTTNFVTTYAGDTSASVHTTPDGLNVVDKGPTGTFCGSTSSLACVTYWNTSAGFFTEVDMRFSDTKCFTNSNASGCHDYQGVAAHESGHALGLKHANSSPYLTMYYLSTPATTRWRTLARGDILGMRAIYGG